MVRRYIKDSERKELFHQAISFCMQSFKNLLKKHGTDCRDEKELQSLMIEIYKAHKKCVKYIVQKESHFSALLVDSYKVYIEGKPTKIPDNVNALDFVIRICQHEIAARKFQEKNSGNLATTSTDTVGGFTKVTATIPVTTPVSTPIVPTLPPSTMITTQQSSSSLIMPNVSVSMSTGTSTITTTASGLTGTAITVSATSASSSYVSGLSRPRGRPPGSKNSNQSQASSSKLNTAQLPKMDPALINAMMGIYSNPAMIPPMAYSDPAAVTALLAEFYKLTNLTGVSMLGKMGNTFGMPQKDSKQSTASSSNSSTIQSSGREGKAANSLSTKLPASTVISVGSGQLTITPTISTTKASYSKDSTSTVSQSLLSQSKDKYNKSNPQTSGFSSASNIRLEKPSVSVTKVPAQSTSPGFPASLSDFPKSLPKSLTITPTPAGYTGKPPTPNQTPSVTLQPEKQHIGKISLKAKIK